MKLKITKTIVAGAALVLGLGFGTKEAAADSFSVSVHTPTASVGYRNVDGHRHSGYVAAPAPVYHAPAPVIVHRPVVREVHVCSYDRRPVTRVRYDRFGCPVYYTEYISVRTCDAYHRHYDRHHHHRYVRYDDHHGHGHGKHHKHHKHDKHHKHHKHDRYDDDDRYYGKHGRYHQNDQGHRGRGRH